MPLLSLKSGILMCAALVFAGGTAYGAQQLGTLTCTGGAASFTSQVSAYTVSVEQNLSGGSQGSGAGAGKVTFSPADIHVALSDFVTLYPLVAAGTTFSQCTLATGNKGGVTYTFSLVAIRTVAAVASTGTGADASDSYTDLGLQYGALQVTAN